MKFPKCLLILSNRLCIENTTKLIKRLFWHVRKRASSNPHIFYVFNHWFNSQYQPVTCSPPPTFFLRSYMHFEAGTVNQVRIFKSWIRVDIICLVRDHLVWAGFWNGARIAQSLSFRLQSGELRVPLKSGWALYPEPLGLHQTPTAQASEWSIMVVIMCPDVWKLGSISISEMESLSRWQTKKPSWN